MANLLRSINDCIFGADNHKASSISDEENATVANILQTLLTAEQGGKHLKKQLDDILGTYSWTENILKKILGRVENAIKQGAPMGKAMKDASARALEEAGGFAHDHPFFCAVLAVGVLAILMPWALEALGFAELGVVEGSFAARWQAIYGGYVTPGSLFSYLQRCGMVWRRSVSVVKAGL